MVRELWDFWKATLNLTRARRRAERDPCPPHDYTHGWDFCEKCGQYR